MLPTEKFEGTAFALFNKKKLDLRGMEETEQ